MKKFMKEKEKGFAHTQALAKAGKGFDLKNTMKKFTKKQ
jgi:hypothetical protein